MSWIDTKPLPPRFTEESTPEGIRVVVPAVKNWYLVVGLPVLLVGWVWAEWQSAQEFWTGADRSLGAGALLVAYTIANLASFAYWLWTILGREVFLMRADTLQVRRCMLGLTWTYTFPWDEICHLRFRPEQSHVLNPLFHRWSALLFEHGGGTYIFGHDLDEAEVSHIIALMQQHLPLQLPDNELLFKSLP